MTDSQHPELTLDERLMWRAIDLAAKGQGRVEPNPMVGCVLERDGQILGEGYHKVFGGPHAEIEAIASVTSSLSAKDSTAYVSLEPCCHYGKTPPCTESLIEAGVKRVVLAMEDPFPKVSGGGAKQLREAGIEVVTNVLRAEAVKLNAPYLKRVQTGKPWVIAKWAMTADGKIATYNGDSQWITNESSRLDVHQTRARVDGILTGMGTVRADNPSLNARLPSEHGAASRIADRVVLCGTSVPDATSKLMTTASQIPVRLMVGPQITEETLAGPIAQGAKIHRLENTESTEMIEQTLKILGEEGMTNLLLEAGGELLGSFFDASSIDELHAFVGPYLFGNPAAPGPLGGKGVESVSKAPCLKLQSIERFEDDVKLTYRVKTEQNLL